MLYDKNTIHNAVQLKITLMLIAITHYLALIDNYLHLIQLV